MHVVGSAKVHPRHQLKMLVMMTTINASGKGQQKVSTHAQPAAIIQTQASSLPNAHRWAHDSNRWRHHARACTQLCKEKRKHNKSPNKPSLWLLVCFFFCVCVCVCFPKFVSREHVKDCIFLFLKKKWNKTIKKIKQKEMSVWNNIISLTGGWQYSVWCQVQTC